MQKTYRLYGVVFLMVIVLLAFLQLSKKEVVDWRKNLDPDKKSPFGLYVFNKEANALLHHQLKKTLISPYDYFSKKENIGNQNILIIEKNLDKTSWEKIFSVVQSGSDALIISSEFPKNVEDSLRFLMTTVNYEETNILKFTDKKFENDSMYLNRFPGTEGFYYTSRNNEILGKSDIYKTEIASNFMKIDFGKGHFYLHSDPTFLTNYYLLKPKSQKYVENVFSYLPKRETIWFVDTQSAQSSSVLRFILANPPLKFAWYLLLGSLVLFVVFHGKRKQRIIPLIEPLKNTTLDFVRSIGNLYLQEGDFHDMMAKKSQYFLNSVRMDLLIDTKFLDEQFERKLQLKTGATPELISEAITLIKKGQNPYASVRKEDLLRLNTILDLILKIH